jgi:hypothetical protein
VTPAASAPLAELLYPGLPVGGHPTDEDAPFPAPIPNPVCYLLWLDAGRGHGERTPRLALHLTQTGGAP